MVRVILLAFRKLNDITPCIQFLEIHLRELTLDIRASILLAFVCVSLVISHAG